MRLFNWFRTLGAKIGLALLLIGIVPFVIFGLFSISSSTKALTEETGREVTAQAQVFADELNFFVDEMLRDTRAIVSLPEIVSLDPDRQQAVLTDLYEIYQDSFSQLAIINLSGDIIVTGKPQPAANITEIESYQKAARGEQAHVIAPGLFSEDLFLHMHTPIRDESGRVVAVLGSPLKLDNLAGVLADHAEMADSGVAFLLNEARQVNYHPNAEEMALERDFSSIMLVDSGDDNQTNGVIEYDIDDVSYIGGLAPIDALDWQVVVARPAAEVLTPITNARNLGLGVLLGMVLLSSLVAFLIARSLSRPVRELVGAAEALGDGNMNAPLPEVSAESSEIGVLVNTFANMRYQIADRTYHLQTSEARHRAIVSALSDAIFLIHRNGTILDFSSPSRGDNSIKAADRLVGVDFYQFVRRLDASDSYESMLSAFKTALVTSTPQEITCQLLLGDSVQDFEVRFGPSGAEEIVAIFRNVTRLKKDALEIHKQSLAIAAASDGMAILDSNQVFSYANKAFAKLNGFDVAQSVIGTSLYDLYDGDEQMRIKEIVLPIVKSKETWRGDAVALRKSGGSYHQEISLTQIETGEIVCVIRDISQRKNEEVNLRAEKATLAQRVEDRTEELEATNKELERAVRLKDEFLANMSHELRTPLNAILGMTEALSDEVYGEMNDKQHMAVRRADESGQHLLQLINDVLNVSKIEAGQLELDPKQVDIEALCQSSLALIQSAAEKKDLSVSYQSSSTNLAVLGDERRLKQILVNLLTNAVKFTPAGGRIGLDVDADSASGQLRFTVWDTGIGIAQEHLNMLFQPFVQLDGSLARQHEGSGLGLALSRRLALLHEGEIWVESQEGKGSMFTLVLPWEPNPDFVDELIPLPDADLILASTPDLEKSIKDAENSAENNPSFDDLDEKTITPIDPDQSDEYRLEAFEFDSAVNLPDEPTHIISPNGHASDATHILLAEDNELNIMTFADYLRHQGYRVTVARTGVEAIEMAAKDTPDLVLMDIQMPKMDGLEATRQLRQKSSTANTPVIALTGMAMVGDEHRCLDAGANGYLSKPVGLKNLVITIEDHLRTSQKVKA